MGSLLLEAAGDSNHAEGPPIFFARRSPWFLGSPGFSSPRAASICLLIKAADGRLTHLKKDGPGNLNLWNPLKKGWQCLHLSFQRQKGSVGCRSVCDPQHQVTFRLIVFGNNPFPNKSRAKIQLRGNLRSDTQTLRFGKGAVYLSHCTEHLPPTPSPPPPAPQPQPPQPPPPVHPPPAPPTPPPQLSFSTRARLHRLGPQAEPGLERTAAGARNNWRQSHGAFVV